MKNMDKFLRAIGDRHSFSYSFEKDAPQPDKIMARLKEILSDGIMEELEGMMLDYTCEIREYSIVQGMKVTIEIMDGDYEIEV